MAMRGSAPDREPAFAMRWEKYKGQFLNYFGTALLSYVICLSFNTFSSGACGSSLYASERHTLHDVSGQDQIDDNNGEDGEGYHHIYLPHIKF